MESKSDYMDTLGKNLERLGHKYVTQELSQWNVKIIEESWWEALKFFFGRTFMRGRRDELSVRYMQFAIQVIDKYFGCSKSNKDSLHKFLQDEGVNKAFDDIKRLKKGRSNLIKHDAQSFKRIKDKYPLIEALTTEAWVNVEFPKGEFNERKVSINNGKDLLMILNTLVFVKEIKDKEYNLFIQYREFIERDVGSAYNELVKLEGIGDKLATFILRDIVLLTSMYEGKDYVHIFPVDTWVAQIASKILPDGKTYRKNPKKAREELIRVFKEHNLALIAAGLWYLGFNSLDLSIHYLKHNEL